jgi:hypothetical protein
LFVCLLLCGAFSVQAQPAAPVAVDNAGQTRADLVARQKRQQCRTNCDGTSVQAYTMCGQKPVADHPACASRVDGAKRQCYKLCEK